MPNSRIQERNRKIILEAALDVFSQNGYRGATVDLIAKAAGLSKQNLLYYFASKEAIHAELLNQLLDLWLNPLVMLDPNGDPVEEILAYVRHKLKLARELPRESRLFANEIVQGAPRVMDTISGPLKELVDAKAEIIRAWAQAGKIAQMDPYHLIFSIWATTQHYADFDAQVRGILSPIGDAHFDDAEMFLTQMFRRALSVH